MEQGSGCAASLFCYRLFGRLSPRGQIMNDRESAENAAEDAGLKYVTDSSPGITRHRAGKGVFYRDSNGEKVEDEKHLERIKSLAIPPAWNDVWIAKSPNAHLQATGRDARDRKQYRYHPRWAEVRDKAKFEHVVAFGNALPGIRERVDADMRKHGLPREKVLAALVKLLELTLIRVGNDEYAKTNKSFGLTTMRDRHADIDGSTISFSFVGKGGIDHEIDLQDRRLATIVRKCQDLPGQRLFQYVDEDGEQQHIHSEDINSYVKEISGQDFTAKDYRTWAGTMLAAEALAELDIAPDETTAKSNVVEAIENVSKHLGNTPTICRKCYVHPAVIDAYIEGETISSIKQRAENHKTKSELSPLESAVLELLVQKIGSGELVSAKSN